MNFSNLKSHRHHGDKRRIDSLENIVETAEEMAISETTSRKPVFLNPYLLKGFRDIVQLSFVRIYIVDGG